MIDEIISDDAARIASQTEKLSGRRILITGGAGFIGSWLCDILTTAGSELVCVDNLPTGLTENIDHHQGGRNFKFIERDISTLNTPLSPQTLSSTSPAAPPPTNIRFVEGSLSRSNLF